jgi:transposase InsO family protein
MFIDGPPEPVFDPANVHAHFVELPLGTPAGFPVAQTLREELTEFDAPGANGFAEEWRPRERPFTTMGDGDAPFQQQFFDIPIAQGEAVIQPDGVANDREREPVAREFLIAHHHVTLPQQLATTDGVESFRDWYNHVRLHSALEYVCPWAKLLETAKSRNAA